MQTLVPPSTFSGARLSRRRIFLFRSTRRVLVTKVRAAEKCEDSGDKYMATLRKRIREVEAVERSDDDRTVAIEECEKELRCTFYESNVLEILGLMQLHWADDDDDDRTVRDEQPRLSVGFAVTVTLSVPVQVLVVMLHLADAAKRILDVMQPKR